MKKYGFEQRTAGYISGSVYDVSMVLSPFLGALIVSDSKHCHDRYEWSFSYYSFVKLSLYNIIHLYAVHSIGL